MFPVLYSIGQLMTIEDFIFCRYIEIDIGENYQLFQKKTSFIDKCRKKYKFIKIMVELLKECDRIMMYETIGTIHFKFSYIL